MLLMHPNVSIKVASSPAVPELVATSAAPISNFDCNLDDEDLCGMTQDTRSQFYWSWRGNTSQPVMGPVGDHTSGSTSGYYIFVPEVPNGQLTTETGRVLSPVFAQNSNPRCLQFYYFMNGINDAGSLNVYILLDGGTLPSVPDWSSSTNMGNVWNAMKLSLSPQIDNFQIVFEGVRRPAYDGTVAIDDILLLDNTECPKLNASSDFEDGLGDFVQDETDDMDWLLWSSSTPTLDTGPSFDHTYGNSSGHYLYIETSAPAVTGHIARLKSPMLVSTTETPRCLTFWYHIIDCNIRTFCSLCDYGRKYYLLMFLIHQEFPVIGLPALGGTSAYSCPSFQVFGAACFQALDVCNWEIVDGKLPCHFGYGIDVASLNIFITNGTTVPNPTYLWSMSGNRGDKWRAGEVQLHSQTDFQVVLEGIRGIDFSGDIAIDDVIIDSKFCPGESNFYNYSSISCNFEEKELCYYEQDQTDDGDWIWQNRATDESFTGPDRDHTTDSELGFFLYISEGLAGDGASRLWSPMADPQNAPSCLQFWYHMYGTDVETLNVYIKKDGQTLPTTPSWSMSGNQGNYWHRATFDINIINVGFRVIFEGVTGQDYKDDIAIDDVTFYNSTSCPIVTTDPPLPTTLPPSQDEANCDFESDDICGYSQLFDDEMDWIRFTGSTPSAGTGPTADHTLGTSGGYYMYLECSDSYEDPGDVAHLASPYLNPTTEPPCMEFYYHMWGADVDMLNIYVVEFGSSMPIDPHLTLFGDRGNQWLQALVDMPILAKPYRVIFEASKGITFEGDIAIDDIMFYDGSCPQATSVPSVEDANCDFESQNNTLCGYYQDDEDDFDWTLNSGDTNSDFTGPSADHTLGTPEGHYIYLETSIPQRPGQQARLMSPSILGNMDDLCLQFYYHMNGEDVGYLRVLWSAMYYEDKEMLRIVGDQGDLWTPASVNLQSTGAEFTFIFEGLVGSGKRGDIAIDDIRILRQPCQGYPKESACTFDAAGPEDFCGYQQSTLDDFDWQWYDGTSDNAPVNGDSAYVYFSPLQAQPGQRGKLVSPKIAGMSTQHCLDFDYLLHKDTTQQLIIGVMKSDGMTYNLQNLIGGSAKWAHHSRTLNDTEVGRNFQILFIGVVGDSLNGTGIIALDNPTIRLGKCQELPPPDTGEQVMIEDDNSSTIILGVLLGLVLIMLIVSVAFFVNQSKRKQPPVSDVSIKYTNGENKNVALPKDMNIENPNYLTVNLPVNDYNATDPNN
ncbi:MAM and LDL-receptor class A domain-containing protein 2-like [Amphiura filiformis]|uniref:MAM and LDL-receptor class A domain-containing protein 2-like n=1 Tax=Amphiura filiformis TaxID=82378 RepID=UPI003B220567